MIKTKDTLCSVLSADLALNGSIKKIHRELQCTVNNAFTVSAYFFSSRNGQ